MFGGGVGSSDLEYSHLAQSRGVNVQGVGRLVGSIFHPMARPAGQSNPVNRLFIRLFIYIRLIYIPSCRVIPGPSAGRIVACYRPHHTIV